MKKFGWLTILTALVLALGCLGAACADVIAPEGPGQQIGYPAVVLCETLSLREKPSSSAKAVQILHYGDRAIASTACWAIPRTRPAAGSTWATWSSTRPGM